MKPWGTGVADGLRRVPLVRVDMPIQFNCPSCQAALRLNDESAGRRGQCPKCQTQIVVPKLASNANGAQTANSSKISNATVGAPKSSSDGTSTVPSAASRSPDTSGPPKAATIEFRCDACGKRIRAPSSAAGDAVACPGCGQKLRVPGVAPSAAPADVGPAVALGPGPATSPSPFDELSDALLGGNTAASAGFEGGLSASSPQPRGKKKPIGLYVVIGGGVLALVVLPVVVFVLFGSGPSSLDNRPLVAASVPPNANRLPQPTATQPPTESATARRPCRHQRCLLQQSQPA